MKSLKVLGFKIQKAFWLGNRRNIQISCFERILKMKKLGDKQIKELVLSNKQLTQKEFDTIRNRSEEFKNIVFRKVNNA